MSQFFGKFKSQAKGALKSPLVWRVVFTALFLCISQAAFAVDMTLKGAWTGLQKTFLSPWAENAVICFILLVVFAVWGLFFAMKGKGKEAIRCWVVGFCFIYLPWWLYSIMPQPMKDAIAKAFDWLKPS